MSSRCSLFWHRRFRRRVVDGGRQQGSHNVPSAPASANLTDVGWIQVKVLLRRCVRRMRPAEADAQKKWLLVGDGFFMYPTALRATMPSGVFSSAVFNHAQSIECLPGPPAHRPS